MSEPDEAMVEAVARAINAADNAWADAPRTMPHEVWPTHVARAALSVPVVRDALAAAAHLDAARALIPRLRQYATEVHPFTASGFRQSADELEDALYPPPGDR